MILIRWLKTIRHSYLCEKIMRKDIKHYKKCYVKSRAKDVDGSREARDILVFCHVVEKGLSHREIKPLFAYERMCLISSSLESYLKKGGTDSYIINMAVATINKYNAVNLELGVDKARLISLPTVSVNDVLNIGTETVTASEFFKASKSSFTEMSQMRHSVRLYDCESDIIEKEELLKCIKNAQNCPSACNRQAVRVKIVLDKDKIRKLSEAQGGANGFGENAGAILVITVDLTLYQPEERRLPMLDSGLFVMNLVYALYENELGTCILNASFTEEREREVQELIHIPQNEMFASLIAVSKIPQAQSIKVAHSCKRDVNDIVTLI